MPNLIGQTLLNQYRVDAFIASGGMADVYRASDLRSGKPVAFKFIQPQGFRQSDQFLPRFRREAKVMARLDHPNIVRLLDYGDLGGQPFMVMEYLDGGTLRARMQGRQIAWQAAAQVILPIARALEYAHAQNIIHRDIKPGNILFTRSGQPKLADFGVAKIVAEEMTLELTGTNTPIGTPAYMAPEQARGEAEPRSDIYALGVVLYELLAGRKPFEGNTPFDMMLKHASEPPAPLHRYVPTIPQAAEELVMRCLAKRPQDRLANMSALVVALERAKNTSAVSNDQTVLDEADFKKIAPAPEIQPKKEVDKQKIAPLPKKLEVRQRTVLGWMIPVILLMFILVWSGMQLSLSATPSNSSISAVTSMRPELTWTSTHIQFEPTWTSTPPWAETTTAIVPTKTATLPPLSAFMVTSPAQITDDKGISMALVPAGTFTMGSTKGENEMPVHDVYLDSYYIDLYEVTNNNYKSCVDAKKCDPPADSEETNSSFNNLTAYGNYPAVYVTWNMADAYCKWRDARLPTEAEWEKAARGTDGRIYPWGNQFECGGYANYWSEFYKFGPNYTNFCSGGLVPVGLYDKGKSPYGIYDIAGNALEWVIDYFDPTYYKISPNENPQGSITGVQRTVRGGYFDLGYYIEYRYTRSTFRYEREPSRATSYIGFRCARSQ